MPGADKYDSYLGAKTAQFLDFNEGLLFHIVTIDDCTIRPPLREKQLNRNVRSVECVDVSQDCNSAAVHCANALEPTKRMCLQLAIKGAYVICFAR